LWQDIDVGQNEYENGEERAMTDPNICTECGAATRIIEQRIMGHRAAKQIYGEAVSMMDLPISARWRICLGCGEKTTLPFEALVAKQEQAKQA
jgi:ferredoxin